MMRFFKDAPSSKKQHKEKTHHAALENSPKSYTARRPVILKDLPENSFLRLDQVLSLIPVGKSTWWAGCKSGRFPKPIKLGPRTTVWRVGDIIALMEQFAQK